MSKVFSTFLLIVFVILALTIFANLKSVFASHTIDDSTISIKQNPFPIETDSKSVTFTITATRDIFETGKTYSFNTWKPGGQHKDNCEELQVGSSTIGTGNKGARVSTNNPKELVITSEISACRAEIGNWHLEVWLGETIQSRNTNTLIIRDYNFEVQQTGGGTPQIIPVKTPLELSETPYVNLINARSGNWYSFWWAGWTGINTDLANRYQATTDGNIPNIELNKTGGDFDKPEIKTLCMEIGYFEIIIPTVVCRYQAAFDFKIIIPPSVTQPSCSIEPSGTLKKGDSVSIKAINLPLNQEFTADLVSPRQTTNLPARQNSGNSGIVTLNLSPHLGEGTYTASVYNANNQLIICSVKDFKVEPLVPGTAPPPTVKKCGEKDEKGQVIVCSSAGGDPCTDEKDGRGSAIKTAIGCIHTSPAEFVKDFMTFIIAISGGLAFLMMLLGAFGMLTSAGNPEALNAGKERLTSAIIGLLFVIFAVLLMQIIGLDILKLPGFGR